MKIKKIGIVSLSSGIISETFVRHEVKIELERLKKYDIEVVFLEYSQKGLEYLSGHPEKRAEDLLTALRDETIDMILCAIGGDDTFKLLPYLFENQKLEKAAKLKIFLGFSDTTMNHFMLNKVGINTFYGQAFLPDICEIGPDILPYAKNFFEQLISNGTISKITPSNVWYEERTDFGTEAVGIKMPEHFNKGFELLRGDAMFEGKILGGCLESMYDIFDNTRYEESVELCKKYKLFPTLEEWKNKILLIETSEEKPIPALYQKMIHALQNFGIFDVISGLLVGKPQNQTFYDEYKKVLLTEITNKELPILYNVNVGHATPRCIITFGIAAKVDAINQEITFNSN